MNRYRIPHHAESFTWRSVEFCIHRSADDAKSGLLFEQNHASIHLSVWPSNFFIGQGPCTRIILSKQMLHNLFVLYQGVQPCIPGIHMAVCSLGLFPSKKKAFNFALHSHVCLHIYSAEYTCVHNTSQLLQH